MATSSETIESSLSREGNSQLPFNSKQEPKIREWSQFELDTICALICKHEHCETFKEKLAKRPHTGDTNGEHPDNDARDRTLRLATKLNEALHGIHNYKHDIPISDVRELMDFIETKNEAVMTYITRQSIPFRVTRSKKYVFQRLCNNFNHAFYKWILIRRERLRNPNINTEEEISLLNWVEYYLSSQGKDNYPLGVARIQKNAQLFADSENGWISNSVYARRSREAPCIDTVSSSSQEPRIRLPQRPIPSVEPSRRFHYRKRRRAISRFPPPPPPLPTWGLSAQYKHTDIHAFRAYEKESYEGMETETHVHPACHAYYDYLNSTPASTPLTPASPAYFGNAGLRQTIHPTGPRPETPLLAYQHHSEVQPSVNSTGLQPGSPGPLALPTHENSYNAAISKSYQYPEPPQENGNFDYSSVIDTPTSPSSPMHMSSMMSAGMVGADAGVQTPFKSVYENSYGGDLYHVSSGCSEYSLNY
ncbi:hypothetical protein F5Y12DRAFT_797559 [Xylaria sp. FL1777]|nr:hypothetical protein F5Y12DRAFT_797559 [Xylaria sp. FL1777]